MQVIYKFGRLNTGVESKLHIAHRIQSVYLWLQLNKILSNSAAQKNIYTIFPLKKTLYSKYCISYNTKM